MLLDLLGINKVIKQIKCRLQKLENNSNSNEGDFIPLSGTEVGSPVTGNIELDGSNNPVKIISQSGTHPLTIDDTGTMILECRESNFNSNFGVGSDYIGFYSDNPNFRGIEGHTDLSETYPTNKLIYAQRSYVDKSNSYSTEETLTGGTWIDGKPIYRKVITFNLVPASVNYTEIINVLNLDLLLTARAKFSDRPLVDLIAGSYVYYLNLTSYFETLGVRGYGGNVNIKYNYPYFIAYPIIVEIEYTKTTD